MARNVQLKNKNGIQCFPITYAKNVIMSDGRTLEDAINSLANGENIVFEPYQLQGATRYSMGGVIVGKGLKIDNNSVLSVDSNETGKATYSERIEKEFANNIGLKTYGSEVKYNG